MIRIKQEKNKDNKKYNYKQNRWNKEKIKKIIKVTKDK